MATSRSFAQLAARLDRIANLIPIEHERVMRKVALAVDQVVVLRTPVDTGRARSNWVVTLGKGTRLEVPPTFFQKSGGSALASAKIMIAKFRIQLRSLFIQNNVPYIEQLENGRSAQAPNGMLRFGLLAGINVANREKFSVKLRTSRG